jgi:hypothetical protein
MDTKEARISTLETKCEQLEMRLKNVEAFVAQTLDRYRRLGVDRLDDPTIDRLAKIAFDSAIDGWKNSTATTEERRAATKKILFEREVAALENAKFERRAQADAKLAAEVLEAIRFYEEHGRSPEGYEIIERRGTQ